MSYMVLLKLILKKNQKIIKRVMHWLLKLLYKNRLFQLKVHIIVMIVLKIIIIQDYMKVIIEVLLAKIAQGIKKGHKKEENKIFDKWEYRDFLKNVEEDN